ncbi:ABC transporter ATP-binding protein (plasmid) [Halarchaeum sp. CBA1220]|uniref:ABC transporter ATP-binding protein n=1 Tax=Halarchaeum sp. CBA1220 TaxID=1853682 RepID=UPI000F3AA4A6|nr:ABC transporter ATP-binding protein [Halarchaeum sp. CBA1220]QLC35066.1 ABC transporter ATP-binding protein [Halarchaeum sp. CBA1220]
MEIQLRNITKRFDDLVAVNDLSMTIKDGEFLTLVGPSGCGKTTTLRMIAGLETPTEGTIDFGGRDVTYASPQERELAFVFQAYALYPHMTARENMSFALDHTGVSQEEIERRIDETASMLGIEGHLDKNPPSLSGGQQQRVALGRSIVRDPEVFLLDEPLSNLDAKLRTSMRAELQQLHREIQTTTIYVTHDQEEAMTMSDRVAILNNGNLQQIDTPEVVYSQPANRFVAGFIGSPSMNFLDCRYDDASGTLQNAAFSVEAPSGISGDVATLGVRPEELSIVPGGDGDFSAEVTVFEQIGAYNIIHLKIDGLDETIVAQVDGSKHLDPGDTVGVEIDPKHVHLFDADDDAVYNPPLASEEPTTLA